MVAAATIEDLHADVLGCALRRLDGRSLAAASCATAALRALAADPETWRALCLAEWPSLALPGTGTGNRRLLAALPPRRLFADAFPFPSLPADAAAGELALPLPGELVSAVDVYYGGAPLLSRVVEMPATSPWFLGAPFRVDAVERKRPAPEVAASAAAAAPSPAELELSWVARGRAVNVSSRRPVAVDRHWYTGETLVRFAVVLGGCKFEATVACAEGGGGGGRVGEVSLAVEDADGAAVGGEGALRLLAAAMEAPRRGGEGEPEEAKRRYQEFVSRKKGRKESKARREALVDLCCSAASAAAAPSPAELELSWVARGRAVNVSSRRPVAVDRHWYTGETLVRFAVVLGGCKFEATVACAEGGGGGGRVGEVSLAVEDADGAAVGGEGALRLLAAAMEAPRRGGEGEPEEAKRRYQEFVSRKKGRKESKARREALVDLCCSAASAAVVLTCLAAVALR